jgi:hypothetical protein
MTYNLLNLFKLYLSLDYIVTGTKKCPEISKKERFKTELKRGFGVKKVKTYCIILESRQIQQYILIQKMKISFSSLNLSHN